MILFHFESFNNKIFLSSQMIYELINTELCIINWYMVGAGSTKKVKTKSNGKIHNIFNLFFKTYAIIVVLNLTCMLLSHLRKYKHFIHRCIYLEKVMPYFSDIEIILKSPLSHVCNSNHKIRYHNDWEILKFWK